MVNSGQWHKVLLNKILVLILEFVFNFKVPLIPKNDLTQPDGPSISPSAPFYQSMWFILVLAFGLMMVLVVALALVIHKLGRNKSGKPARMDSMTSQSRPSPDRSIMGMYELGGFGSDESLQDYNVSKFFKLKSLLYLHFAEVRETNSRSPCHCTLISIFLGL